jgi:6-phospho-3-hexuloisomerase
VLELAQVTRELADAFARVSPDELHALGRRLVAASRVFVAGAGRTGLMIKAFGMRLMHLGRTVFAAGETVTPAIEKSDLLVAASCSGTTVSVLEYVRRARQIGASVFAVTAEADSPLAQWADGRLLLPTEPGAGRASEQFGNSLFEQVLMVVLDALVLHLQRALHTPADAMAARHANLE